MDRGKHEHAPLRVRERELTNSFEEKSDSKKRLPALIDSVASLRA